MYMRVDFRTVEGEDILFLYYYYYFAREPTTKTFSIVNVKCCAFCRSVIVQHNIM